MLILGISVFLNNMHLAQLLKDLLWIRSDYYAYVSCWAYANLTVNIFQEFFFHHLLYSLRKHQNENNKPNPHIAKTQTFPLPLLATYIFLYEP